MENKNESSYTWSDVWKVVLTFVLIFQGIAFAIVFIDSSFKENKVDCFKEMNLGKENNFVVDFCDNKDQ